MSDARRTTPPATPTERKTADVLLVEDNALAADAMRLLLETTGHRVRVAGSVADTVRACADRRPDLMLLDLTLPDGSGLDALATIQAAGTAPRMTVALTGHDERAVIQQCKTAGCQAVLVKPVQPRELISRVTEWLG